jgi:23S rRNA (guanosine2251-2'-O)-methyltransferase
MQFMRKLNIDELDRLTVEAFKATPKKPFVVVLDNLRSMHNVGSAFRTADAYLAEKIYLCGITGQPPHREIHKTALGATESVEWEYWDDTIEVIHDLKKRGFKILVVEQADQSTMLQDMRFRDDQKYAFIFGNEVFGVKEEVVEMADAVIEIPQFGTKHSLNVSVSVGVVLWELVRCTVLKGK